MADHDTSPLDNDFEDLWANLLSQVAPPGPDAVRRTVRRRRRTGAAVAAVAVLALVAGSAAAYAVNGRHEPTPGTTFEPASPTASPTESVTPSASPSASPPPTSGPSSLPERRITRAELLATTVDLPAWPSSHCQSRHTRLTERYRDFDNKLETLTYGDVDHDGRAEPVALVRCVFGTRGWMQVVAFDRSTTGAVVTLGRVVATASPAPEWIGSVEVRSDGAVRVQVYDIAPGSGWPLTYSRQQWRTYAWNGERFTQVDGPVEFPLTDLKLSGGRLTTSSPDASGGRHGSLTLTVTNAGPYDAEQIGFSYLRNLGEPDGGAWDACLPDPSPSALGPDCVLPGLRAGQQRTYTFRFVLAAPPVNTTVMLQRLDPKGRPWHDRNQTDDQLRVSYSG